MKEDAVGVVKDVAGAEKGGVEVAKGEAVSMRRIVRRKRMMRKMTQRMPKNWMKLFVSATLVYVSISVAFQVYCWFRWRLGTLPNAFFSSSSVIKKRVAHYEAVLTNLAVSFQPHRSMNANCFSVFCLLVYKKLSDFYFFFIAWWKRSLAFYE